MFNGGNGGNDNLGNFLDALGVILALVNIDLNDKQIDTLNEHLRQQDNQYLKKLIDKVEVSIQQNNKLLELDNILIRQNKEIIQLLRGEERE